MCIDDEVEARMLSKHCGRRIEGILVQNQKTFDKYLELLKDSKNGVYPPLAHLFSSPSRLPFVIFYTLDT